MLIQSVYEQLNKNNNVIFIVERGSFLYNNKIPSDHDYICIVENDNIEVPVYPDTDIQIISFNNFLNYLSFHTIESMEIISLLEMYLFQEYKLSTNLVILNEFHKGKILKIFPLIIDKLNLRKSISSVSSNSYVKAKKKIILDKDFNKMVSLKSLWHSFRIVDFGIQILDKGLIIDFESSNHLYKEIEEDYKNINKFNNKELFWDFIHKKYKPLYNKQKSIFRLKTEI